MEGALLVNNKVVFVRHREFQHRLALIGLFVLQKQAGKKFGLAENFRLKL